MSSQCEVQAYLRCDGTLETLTKELFIKVKRHSKYPQLVQLKYDQIQSPMNDSIVKECRGLILDENDSWAVVARPFDKFFNAEEGNAAKIDWSTAKVQEKLDGSLAILYHFDNEWHVATSGTPDASGNVNGLPKTFKELFWETFEFCNYSTESLNPEYTFMFELMTPLNRIVVNHLVPALVLIGVRNRATGLELHVDNLPDNFKTVKHFEATEYAKLLKSFDFIDGLEQEGYVVVDGDFNRIKIKHPKYVLYHQFIGSLTQRKMLDAIRMGEVDEVIAYFPAWASIAEELKWKYECMAGNINQVFESIRSIGFRKEFAAEATKYPFSAALFAMYGGKVTSAREYLQSMRIEALSDLLKIKEESQNEQ